MTIKVKMKVQGCPVCGVVYALTSEFVRVLRKNPGKAWCCPCGHVITFEPAADQQARAEVTVSREKIIQLQGAELVYVKGALIDARQRAETAEAELARLMGGGGQQ